MLFVFNTVLFIVLFVVLFVELLGIFKTLPPDELLPPVEPLPVKVGVKSVSANTWLANYTIDRLIIIFKIIFTNFELFIFLSFIIFIIL